MKPELELVRTGVITPQQYVEAIQRQTEETTPLGQIAIEAGLMTAREVFEVLHRQRTDGRRRFGDLAIELGYLDRGQVALLLLEQLERRRSVMSHLQEMGVLPALESLDDDTIEAGPYDVFSNTSAEAAALAMV